MRLGTTLEKQSNPGKTSQAKPRAFPTVRIHLSHTVRLFFSTERANVLHHGVNLILAEGTLERRHSPLPVGNYLGEFRIGQLLNCRPPKVGTVTAFSNLRASAVCALAHCAFCSKRRCAGCVIVT